MHAWPYVENLDEYSHEVARTKTTPIDTSSLDPHEPDCLHGFLWAISAALYRLTITATTLSPVSIHIRNVGFQPRAVLDGQTITVVPGISSYGFARLSLPLSLSPSQLEAITAKAEEICI